MSPSLRRDLAIGLESVATCVVMAGIFIEVVMKADAGFILITAGALGVAAGSILAKKFIKHNH